MKMNKDHIWKVTELFPESIKVLIRLRYGLVSNEMTLGELGRLFNLSRERIRQIIEKYLRIAKGELESISQNGKPTGRIYKRRDHINLQSQRIKYLKSRNRTLCRQLQFLRKQNEYPMIVNEPPTSENIVWAKQFISK